MIASDEDKINVMTYVKWNCQLIKLSPQTLGMLFELYADVQYDEDYATSGISDEISIEELKKISILILKALTDVNGRGLTEVTSESVIILKGLKKVARYQQYMDKMNKTLKNVK